MADTPYTPQVWLNGISGATPIDQARLNHMENGIQSLSINKLNESQVRAIVAQQMQTALLNN